MAGFSLYPGNVPSFISNILNLPMTPFPAYSPLPPLPVPPGGYAKDTFDLSQVDSANEALVMPGADLLTGLLVSASPSKRGDVTVLCGTQSMQYSLNQGSNGQSIAGNINGKPFSVPMRQMPGATYINGMTPGGPIGENISYMQGSSTAVGTAGLIDYNQTYVSDPTPQSGHCAIWSGTLGPHGGPPTQGFGIEITNNPSGDGFLLNGYIGDKPMTGTLKNPRPGTVVIERNVGALRIQQTIQMR